MEITILHFDTLGSTNTEAAEQARRGAAEGLCIIAEQQTAGRGRYGRTWISPPGSGLYFSIVLRPRLASEHFPLITLMAGIAVHDSLEILEVESDIKWVNDLLVGEKKISGILAEAIDTPQGSAIILGIGINLKTPGEAAVPTATSIFDETQQVVTPGKMAEILTEQISSWYSALCDLNGPDIIINEWGKRSSFFRDKAVRVKLADRMLDGRTDGLEPNGALRVFDSSGALHIVQAGDVEQLRTRAA